MSDKKTMSSRRRSVKKPQVEPEVQEVTEEAEESALGKDETKPAPAAVPAAESAASSSTMETAVALKTCVKFVGGWHHLVKGKKITAPKEILANLRQNGFVE